MASTSTSRSPSPSPDPSPDPARTSSNSLFRHLLASKRSLTTINHVYRANALCTETRNALESSVITAARTAFLRHGVSSQLSLLQQVARSDQHTINRGRAEYEAVVEDLDAADGRLRETMQALRVTMVESKLRPEDEESRSLLSFVDEEGMGDATEGARQIMKNARHEAAVFEDIAEKFQAGLSEIQVLMDTHQRPEEPGDTHSGGSLVHEVSPLPDILTEMDDHAREMAINLESLVSHFDLCVRAVKDIAGDGQAALKIAGDVPDGLDMDYETTPMTEEEKTHMIEVLEDDASQVEDVVLEIRQHGMAIETLQEQVKAYTASLTHESETIASAFHRLEDLSQTLPDHLDCGRTFLARVADDRVRIADRLDELESIRDFYGSFLHAYDRLLVEIGRRKALELHMEKVAQDAMTKIEHLYADDVEKREVFKREQGDFLPGDIWPGLMDEPARWRLVVAEGPQRRVPDISSSIIHRAIRRVHGQQ